MKKILWIALIAYSHTQLVFAQNFAHFDFEAHRSSLFSIYERIAAIQKDTELIESEKTKTIEEFKERIRTEAQQYLLHASFTSIRTDNGRIEITGSTNSEINQRLKILKSLTDTSIIYKPSLTFNVEMKRLFHIGQNAAQFVTFDQNNLIIGTPEALFEEKTFDRLLANVAMQTAHEIKELLNLADKPNNFEAILQSKEHQLKNTIEYIFSKNNVDYVSKTRPENNSEFYIIKPNKNSPLNRVAFFLKEKHNNIKLVVDAYAGIEMSAGGLYSPSERAMAIGIALDALVNRKNATLHHELLHSKFDNVIDPVRQTVFSLSYQDDSSEAEKDATEKSNPYLKYASLEEILTQLQDAMLHIHHHRYNGAKGEIKMSLEITEAAIEKIETLLANQYNFEFRTNNNKTMSVVRLNKIMIRFDSFPPMSKDEAVDLLTRARRKLLAMKYQIQYLQNEVERAQFKSHLEYKALKRDLHRVFKDFLYSDMTVMATSESVAESAPSITLPATGLRCSKVHL